MEWVIAYTYDIDRDYDEEDSDCNDDSDDCNGEVYSSSSLITNVVVVLLTKLGSCRISVGCLLVGLGRTDTLAPV